jgi:group I intron endonuclease
MDYQNGKIYKITNCIDDEVYVGSTCQSLSRRFSKHKDMSRCRPNYKIYQHFNKLGIDKFCISLIEDYPCNNKTELRCREGVFIKEQGTLNSQIECQTAKEYREENKEKIAKNERIS